MVASIRSLVITTKWAFHCVNTRMTFVLIKESYSCGWFLWLLVSKPRVGIDKERINCTKNKWEQPGIFGCSRHLASIHENIFFPTVPMEITKNGNLPLLCKRSNQLLGVVNCGVEDFTWLFPPSVKVTARQTAPIISINHSVRIEHRNYLKHEVLS